MTPVHGAHSFSASRLVIDAGRHTPLSACEAFHELCEMLGNSSLFPIFASAEFIAPGHQGEPGHAPKGDAPVSATLNTPAGRHSPGTRSSLSTGQSQRKGARRTSITNLVSDRSHQSALGHATTQSASGTKRKETPSSLPGTRRQCRKAIGRSASSASSASAAALTTSRTERQLAGRVHHVAKRRQRRQGAHPAQREQVEA